VISYGPSTALGWSSTANYHCSFDYGSYYPGCLVVVFVKAVPGAIGIDRQEICITEPDLDHGSIPCASIFNDTLGFYVAISRKGVYVMRSIEFKCRADPRNDKIAIRWEFGALWIEVLMDEHPALIELDLKDAKEIAAFLQQVIENQEESSG